MTATVAIGIVVIGQNLPGNPRRLTDASSARTRELFNTILGEEGLKFDRDVHGPLSTQERSSSGSGPDFRL